ncbi:MAG: polysaccharide biosynthesis tyrosine autokinase [Longimicrobiales bacterium]|nr:polysaccharide biosynthesis tyrosine autokinase [Longimicrobiales bacterium]
MSEVNGRRPGNANENGDFSGAGETIDWTRILWALRRRMTLVVLIVLLGTVGGYALGTVIGPQYLVEARVWIDPPERIAGVGPIQGGQLFEATGWEELLQSYRVLDDVVRDRKLFLDIASPHQVDGTLFGSLEVEDDYRAGEYVLQIDPGRNRVTLSDSDGTLRAEAPPGQPLGESLGLTWTPPADALVPGRKVEFQLETIRDAAATLARDLEIGIDPKGNFVRVGLRGTDPEAAAATANAVVEGLVVVAGDLNRASLSEKTRILGAQMEASRIQLEEADAALRNFQVRTITLPGRGSTSPGAEDSPASASLVRDYVELSRTQEELQRSREALQRALVTGRDGPLPLESLEGVPIVVASVEASRLMEELALERTELRRLRIRYTDESPPVREAMERVRVLEEVALPGQLRDLTEELQWREASVNEQLRERAAELQRVPARALEEARLTRAVALTQDLHSRLQQRYEEARLAEVSSIPDVRILDPAVAPRVPDSRPGSRLAIIAFMASLGFGLMVAVLLDRTDRRVRYPSQITRGMGLDILGAIPHHSRGRRRKELERDRNVKEAFRALRLNIAHAYGSAGPIIIVVTSPGRGEGKSFVTANLARAFARQRERTLVIDGDTRLGTQHHLMGGDRYPGLVDLLEARVSLESVIQSVAEGTIDFIGSGTRKEDGPELLTTSRMVRLVSHLKSQYDVILVDTPPLRAGVDALALSTLCGNMLFVLRTGTSEREMAETNLDAIDHLPVRVLGAVLNDVGEGGIFRPYRYLPYYQETDALPTGSPSRRISASTDVPTPV